MADVNALGAAAALGSAAAWAVGAFLLKGLVDSLSPLALTLSKGVCSVLMLGAASLFTGSLALDARSLGFVAASGILGIALADTFFFRALQDLSAFALVVLCTLGQAFTVVLAWLVLGEELSGRSVVGIALILAGVVAVLRATSDEDGGRTRLAGILFGLLSMACMAGSTLIMKLGLGQSSDTIAATFWKILAGTVGVLAYGLARRKVPGWLTPFRDRKVLGWFLVSVSVVTFGAFWLNTVALKYASVVVASTLGSTEPVFALLIAAVVMRQRIAPVAVVGTAVTVAGVVLLSVPEVASYLQEFTSWLF